MEYTCSTITLKESPYKISTTNLNLNKNNSNTTTLKLPVSPYKHDIYYSLIMKPEPQCTSTPKFTESTDPFDCPFFDSY
jgi:hypothetical protein